MPKPKKAETEANGPGLFYAVMTMSSRSSRISRNAGLRLIAAGDSDSSALRPKSKAICRVMRPGPPRMIATRVAKSEIGRAHV